MIVALFPNTTKKQSHDIAVNIHQFLTGQNVQVVVPDQDAAALNAAKLSSVSSKAIDCMICLGGDGTILRVIHSYPDIKAPIMAINLGSLGFMADIPIDDFYIALKNLVAKNYVVQERMIMEGRTKSKSCFAVNEITIHRGVNSCLIDLAVFVDNQYLNTFSADGIIVATPSGSTAYSLAAGGPIVSPELEAFVITPICPHTLSNRPIVLKPKVKITIKNLSDCGGLTVDYDGFSDFKLDTDEEIHISVSQQKFPLITFPEHDYFATLRTKLGWSGKIRL